MRTAWSIIITLGLALAADAARAGEPRAREPAGARALFEEGMRLLDQGSVEEACPRLAESARLEPRVVTQMALAGCYEQLGRIATAWQAYEEVARQAAAAGESEWQREIFARDRARVLEKKVPRLTIRAGDGTPGLVIRLDQRVIQPSQLGTPLPVDPGEHVLTAAAVGYETWTVTFRLAPRKAAAIAVPPLDRAKAAPQTGGDV